MKCLNWKIYLPNYVKEADINIVIKIDEINRI